MAVSKYTTGEIAKLCGVSVRTVQYYDTRNILSPSELSEGGRRLYSDEDVKKLKIICFLRELGLPLNSIGELLTEEDPGSVIDLLLEQQEQALRAEITERQIRLQRLEMLQKELKGVERFSVESIGDIAYQMENKKKLYKLRWTMLAVGLVSEAIEISTAIYWYNTGIWWPFAVGMIAVIGLCTWISLYYFRNVEYICPQCHTVFKPTLREAFFAYHTPNTRKLTCTKCGHKGYCVEIYAEKKRN